MKLAILGTGGHASAVESAWGGKRSLPRFEYPTGLTQETHGFRLMVGIGGVSLGYLERRLLALTEMRQHYDFHTMISARAVTAQPRDLRIGVVIMPMAFVGPHAIVGDFAIINTGAIIEHGASIGAGTHIAPGAVVAGNAVVSERCFVGANAVVAQGAFVLPDTFIKAGSVFNQGVPK